MKAVYVVTTKYQEFIIYILRRVSYSHIATPVEGHIVKL